MCFRLMRPESFSPINDFDQQLQSIETHYYVYSLIRVNSNVHKSLHRYHTYKSINFISDQYQVTIKYHSKLLQVLTMLYVM